MRTIAAVMVLILPMFSAVVTFYVGKVIGHCEERLALIDELKRIDTLREEQGEDDDYLRGVNMATSLVWNWLAARSGRLFQR